MTKEDMIMKALTKLIKEMKEMKENIATVSESVDLLVKIETEKIQKGD